jgi:U3 small nucleolar RNA-associated protein 15
LTRTSDLADDFEDRGFRRRLTTTETTSTVYLPAMTTTATIQHASSSTNEYKSTSSLQIKRHKVSSVTRRKPSTGAGDDGNSTGDAKSNYTTAHNDINEARYWTQKLGLGSQKYGSASTRNSLYAHPRSLTLQPGRKSGISHHTEQVLLGPKLTSRHPPLAVVSGPRVSLYGTSSTGSAYIRALLQSHNNHPNKDQNLKDVGDNDGGGGDDDNGLLFGGTGGSDSTSVSNVEPDRQVPTGGHLARCAAFRHDGRLLAVGTDEVGQVRISDVTMRSTLTTFSASNYAIRTVQWFRNGQHLLAGGDDGVVRIWHLSQANKERPVAEWTGHGDVIRCSAIWQKPKTKEALKTKTSPSILEWDHLVMTGSYDHTVRVWSVDQSLLETDGGGNGFDKNRTKGGQCLAVLQHGSPVEAICLLKSEHPDLPVWLLSAGGTTVKVWNPVTGKCVSTVLTFHRKTITSMVSVLRFNYDDSRLQSQKVFLRVLTASLDGVIQFHSWNAATGQMSHLYSTKLHDSITSIAADTTGERLVFGTVSGQVFVRMRGPSVVQKKREGDPRAGTFSFFQRGMNEVAGSGDFTVMSQGKKRKLQKHDIAMKQFRYSDALDEALATRRPRDVMGVLEELGKRRALTPALSNRDEESLEPVLSFILRYIRKPHYTGLLSGVTHRLIDIYASTRGHSDKVDELFKKLRHQVSLETRAQRDVMKLVGQIESIIANGL